MDLLSNVPNYSIDTVWFGDIGYKESNVVKPEYFFTFGGFIVFYLVIEKITRTQIKTGLPDHVM